MNNYFDQLGQKIELGKHSKDLIDDSGIGFGVSESPIYQFDPSTGIHNRIKGFKCIHKDGQTGNVLGIVGNKYTLVHVREALQLIDPFIDEGILSYEYAGVATNKKNLGLKIWVLARISEEFEIAKGDKIFPYLLITNSYDGSLALSIRSTSIRIQCWNQYQSLINEAKSLRDKKLTPDVLRIKHTKTAYKRFLSEGKRFIDNLLLGQIQAVKTYQKMGNEQLEIKDFQYHLAQAFDAYNFCLLHGKKWKPYENLEYHWANSEEGIPQYSALSLYNSVTRWITHERGHTNESRFYSAQWGGSYRESKKLFASLSEEVE